MGDKIKLTPTKLNADGTGYYRGTDGRQYYGHPQNGYVVETEQSKRARAAQSQAAAPSQSYASGIASGGGGGCGIGIIEGLLGGTISAIWLIGMTVAFFVLLALSVVMVWPWYIKMLAEYFQRGQADFMVVLTSAAVAFLIFYLILSIIKVFKTKKMRSRRYILVSIITMTVPSLPVGLLLGQLELIPTFAFAGAVLSILPAFILCWVEHLATKEIRGDKEWFATKIARLLSRVFPFHTTGMIVVGVIVILFSGILKFAFDSTGAQPIGIGTGPMTYTITGILLIIGGLVVKKKDG